MNRPDPLTRLIEQLQRLPGIGAKSAGRLAFHVLKTPREEVERLVEATAGGGMVTVAVNGTKQLMSLRIDPEVVSKDDVEMLQDLIVAAINDAQRKADDEMKAKTAGMLPPGFNL